MCKLAKVNEEMMSCIKQSHGDRKTGLVIDLI